MSLTVSLSLFLSSANTVDVYAGMIEQGETLRERHLGSLCHYFSPGDPTTTDLRDMEKFVGKKRKRVKKMIGRWSRQEIEKMHEAFICGFIDHE